MKVLLVAVNSKFIHSNLAVRYLKNFTKDIDYVCKIKEFTINNIREKVLQEIMIEKPDLVAFSCYIWNIEYIEAVATLINKIDNNIKILYGGPEVSYDSKKFLENNIGNYVIEGEGEEIFREVIEYELYYQGKKNKELLMQNNFVNDLTKIKGLFYKKDGKVFYNGKRQFMDMKKIIFPYTEKDNLENKIVYYEASRGCPFNCKYCLSSTFHGVRFLDLQRVKKELKFLIDKKVKLIKFVDRTFNCNPKFAMSIWKFLIEQDTDTVFHFEISGDILTNEEIELLSKAPVGRFQFEIGVQTTNNQVLKNINRFVNFEDIKEKVLELKKLKNIKQHLDLIAGLPGEDFQTFKKSFNDLYEVKPEEIQLGFLKLLKGSDMRKEAEKWGMVYSPYPPYEILKTKDISYEELVKLKRVEEVLDKYYNSGKFSNILKYFIPKFNTPFDFYYNLGTFFYKKGYLNRNVSFLDYYKIFIEFNEQILQEDSFILKEIIKYDFLKFNKKKWIPEFLNKGIDKKFKNIIRDKIKKDNLLKLSKNANIEKFFINIFKFERQCEIEKRDCYLLFDENNIKKIIDITHIALTLI